MNIYVIVKQQLRDNGRERTVESQWPMAVYTNPDDARVKCGLANDRNSVKLIMYDVIPFTLNNDSWLLWAGDK